MPNPLIRLCDHYVVLEPEKPERILNADETLIWLDTWLKTLDKLPEDLKEQDSTETAAKRLLDTACNLEIQPGINLQWFAVRLDPPEDKG
ncbi:chlororespiratory reduction protein 7 [Prochlorococcus sp. MIT 1300]|uniref:chlororespiratory reduction protein 7 n=1 Tax=Prochlorococcus sp. MIT 1300 TaxID=3096218 RepID=UPI002A763041|nr:chlororespiratory reduction protein 7 [Prochlorococcus sp. MIT 1300]